MIALAGGMYMLFQLQVGDLRPYLMGFFDTTSGSKTEAGSYEEISSAIGADDPSEILFATDALKEAQAAREAGWTAVLVTRPGNPPLPRDTGFQVVHSMGDLLDVFARS
jgi:methylthioribulose 1-phosphate dehydratase / enolase-phosphatase E1